MIDRLRLRSHVEAFRRSPFVSESREYRRKDFVDATAGSALQVPSTVPHASGDSPHTSGPEPLHGMSSRIRPEFCL